MAHFYNFLWRICLHLIQELQFNWFRNCKEELFVVANCYRYVVEIDPIYNHLVRTGSVQTIGLCFLCRMSGASWRNGYLAELKSPFVLSFDKAKVSVWMRHSEDGPHYKTFFEGAAVAQWICPRLQSCRPGFESQAHHQLFYQFKCEFKL